MVFDIKGNDYRLITHNLFSLRREGREGKVRTRQGHCSSWLCYFETRGLESGEIDKTNGESV